jgi:hypothetical protein
LFVQQPNPLVALLRSELRPHLTHLHHCEPFAFQSKPPIRFEPTARHVARQNEKVTVTCLRIVWTAVEQRRLALGQECEG